MTRPGASARRRRLRVTVTDGRGGSHPLGRSLGRWVGLHAPREAGGTIAIALVSDRHMRALNRRFRGIDRATDVLSFPAAVPNGRVRAIGQGTGLGSRGSPVAARGSVHLGDLAIALGVAARQARVEGHGTAIELRILALHGVLHLLGYDHERDKGDMRTLEERLRRRAGLPAGLIARRPRRPGSPVLR